MVYSAAIINMDANKLALPKSSVPKRPDSERSRMFPLKMSIKIKHVDAMA